MAGALCVRFISIILTFWGILTPCNTNAQVADTIQAPDSLKASPDSLDQILSDSLPESVDTFPRFPSGIKPSREGAVWIWDRDALMTNRALTLAELVDQVPGVILLKGGDYGTPVSAIAFGVGGGRVKIFWDGFEWVSLDGGVADLSRIGLGGIDEVRVERHPGELRIEIRTREPTDPEPSSTVEVGTGDLGTNLLRGVLAHPNTLGGALTFTLDRLDTRGPRLAAAGALSGIGLRYSLTRGDRGGLSLDLRRFATRTDVNELPTDITRNDWNLKGRWRFTDNLIGEAYWGASSLIGNAKDPFYGIGIKRSQLGIRAGYERGVFWGKAAARYLGSGGLPVRSYEIAGGVSHLPLLSIDGSVRMEQWSHDNSHSWRARAITSSISGVSLFASYENGSTGSPFVPRFREYLQSLELEGNTDEYDAPVAKFTERTGIRAGATFTWRSLSLSGAWLSIEADSLLPLGLALDRDGVTLGGGGPQTGYELSVSMPLPISGFRIETNLQSWNKEQPYLPKRVWDGSITYHGIFKESNNLELWGTIGVTSRDPMLLRIIDQNPLVSSTSDNLDLLRVPMYQDWFMQIQVRIVTVNVFVRWDNIMRKRDNLDFPNHNQPRSRTMYGIRWTMNN